MNHRDKAFSDELNMAHFVEEGVIVNKDGALMMAFEGRGLDLQSASDIELDALSHTVNRMALLLEDGWMLHVDEIRIPSINYPAMGHFPDSVSALIDEERRQQYEAEGVHFENRLILTFVWKFPKPKLNTARHWFIQGLDKEEDNQALQDYIKEFQEKVSRCEGLLSMQLFMKPMNSREFLSYLNFCINGELRPVTVPETGCFLDVTLGYQDLVGGYRPKVGKKEIALVAINNYLSPRTRPALLEGMGTYPLIYRWSNRFVFLSETTADRELKKYRTNWNNKVKGLVGLLMESILSKPKKHQDNDAVNMSQEVNEAIRLNQSRETCFGYYTSDVVIMHEDSALLDSASTSINRYLEQSGFGSMREEVNAMDAWLGTIPGHGQKNMRRMFCHAIHLSHFLPLNTVWSGEIGAHASSLLGKNAPPVFYGATTGNTPFRFNIDVQDVGHGFVIGPTGGGKTTFLALLIAQFLRYENAEVYVLDKNRSLKGLAYALNGHHYEISPEAKTAFCPLADLSTDERFLRAEEWIKQLFILQGLEMNAARQRVLSEGMQRLRQEPDDSRNLTVLHSLIQDQNLREALNYYTLNGSFPMMDATTDSFQKQGHLHVFETDWILEQSEAIHVPVLSYLLNHIRSRMDGRPILIVADEFSSYLSNSLLLKYLIEWPKVARKLNVRLWFATQGLTDLYDPREGTLTPVTAVVVNACETQVFLPNLKMDAEARKMYHKMSLSDRQCEVLFKESIPKRHYFIKTTEGRRLIELGFNDREVMALCFIGLSLEKNAMLIEFQKKYQDAWVYYWLCERGFPEWGLYWLEKLAPQYHKKFLDYQSCHGQHWVFDWLSEKGFFNEANDWLKKQKGEKHAYA